MLTRAGLGLVLAAAVASVAGAQGTGKFDGQYAGELTLTKIIDGDCTEPPRGALYPLTVSGGQVRFAYLPRFATTLTGTVAPDGTFDASARVKRGVVRMAGRIEGSRVIANLVSPSCQYRFRTRN
jgi:hypothetical protein